MRKFEYKLLEFDKADLVNVISVLNEHGAEGWEVVVEAKVLDEAKTTKKTSYILKRYISPEPQMITAELVSQPEINEASIAKIILGVLQSIATLP